MRSHSLFGQIFAVGLAAVMLYFAYTRIRLRGWRLAVAVGCVVDLGLAIVCPWPAVRNGLLVLFMLTVSLNLTALMTYQLRTGYVSSHWDYSARYLTGWTARKDNPLGYWSRIILYGFVTAFFWVATIAAILHPPSQTRSASTHSLS